MALILHVVYKGRALSLAWRMRHSPKEHCPTAIHLAVVALRSTLVPEGTKGVLLGDGECDGSDLQGMLHAVGWLYVCLMAMSTTATWDGQTFRLDTLGACLKAGRLIEVKDVYCTRDAYGPIMVLCCGAKRYQEPLYVISTMAIAEEAYRLYQKRLRIETFFSDQKSRGCHIHKSQIANVQRLSRLLIAAC